MRGHVCKAPTVGVSAQTHSLAHIPVGAEPAAVTGAAAVMWSVLAGAEVGGAATRMVKLSMMVGYFMHIALYSCACKVRSVLL